MPPQEFFAPSVNREASFGEVPTTISSASSSSPDSLSSLLPPLDKSDIPLSRLEKVSEFCVFLQQLLSHNPILSRSNHSSYDSSSAKDHNPPPIRSAETSSLSTGDQRTRDEGIEEAFYSGSIPTSSTTSRKGVTVESSEVPDIDLQELLDNKNTDKVIEQNHRYLWHRMRCMMYEDSQDIIAEGPMRTEREVKGAEEDHSLREDTPKIPIPLWKDGALPQQVMALRVRHGLSSMIRPLTAIIAVLESLEATAWEIPAAHRHAHRGVEERPSSAFPGVPTMETHHLPPFPRWSYQKMAAKMDAQEKGNGIREMKQGVPTDGYGPSYFVAEFLAAVAGGLQPLKEPSVFLETSTNGRAGPLRDRKKIMEEGDVGSIRLSAASMEPTDVGLHTLATTGLTPSLISTRALAERVVCLTHRSVRLRMERAQALIHQALHASHWCVADRKRFVIHQRMKKEGFFLDGEEDWVMEPGSEELDQNPEGFDTARRGDPEDKEPLFSSRSEGEAKVNLAKDAKNRSGNENNDMETQTEEHILPFKTHAGMTAVQQWLVEECMNLYQDLVSTTSALRGLLREEEERQRKEGKEGSVALQGKDMKNGFPFYATTLNPALVTATEEVEEAYLALLRYFDRLAVPSMTCSSFLPSISPCKGRDDPERTNQTPGENVKKRSSALSLITVTKKSRPWWPYLVWSSPVFCSPPETFPVVRSCDWNPTFPHQIRVEMMIPEWTREGESDAVRKPLVYSAMDLQEMGNTLHQAGWELTPSSLAMFTSCASARGTSSVVNTTMSRSGRRRTGKKDFRDRLATTSSSSSSLPLPIVRRELSPLLLYNDEGRRLSLLLRHLPEEASIEKVVVHQCYDAIPASYSPGTASLLSSSTPPRHNDFPKRNNTEVEVVKQCVARATPQDGSWEGMTKGEGEGLDLRLSRTVIRLLIHSPHFSAPFFAWASREAWQRSPRLSFARAQRVMGWSSTSTPTHFALISSSPPPSSWGAIRSRPRTGKEEIASTIESEEEIPTPMSALAAALAVSSTGYPPMVGSRASAYLFPYGSSLYLPSPSVFLLPPEDPAVSSYRRRGVLRSLQQQGPFLVSASLDEMASNSTGKTLLPGGLHCPAVLPPIASPSALQKEEEENDTRRSMNRLEEKEKDGWSGPPFPSVAPPPSLHPLLHQTLASMRNTTVAKKDERFSTFEASQASAPFLQATGQRPCIKQEMKTKREQEKTEQLMETKEVETGLSLPTTPSPTTGAAVLPASFTQEEATQQEHMRNTRESRETTDLPVMGSADHLATPHTMEGEGVEVFPQLFPVSLATLKGAYCHRPLRVAHEWSAEERWRATLSETVLERSPLPLVPTASLRIGKREEGCLAHGGNKPEMQASAVSSSLKSFSASVDEDEEEEESLTGAPKDADHDPNAPLCEHSKDAIEIPEPYRFANGIELHYLSLNAMVLQRKHTKKPWGLGIQCLECPEEYPHLLPMRLVKLPPLRVVKRRGKLVPVMHPFLRVFASSPPRNWYIDTINGLAARHPHHTLPLMSTLTQMVLKFKRL